MKKDKRTDRLITLSSKPTVIVMALALLIVTCPLVLAQRDKEGRQVERVPEGVIVESNKVILSQKEKKETLLGADGIKELLRGRKVSPGENVAYTAKNGYSLVADVDKDGEVVGWSVTDKGGRIVVKVGPIAQYVTDNRSDSTPGEDCARSYQECVQRCFRLVIGSSSLNGKDHWKVLIGSWGMLESCIRGCNEALKSCRSTPGNIH